MKTRVIQEDAEPLASGINHAAPIVARSETEIVAAREVVWRVLTGIEQWPAWNPEVKSAAMKGGLREGVQFHWRAGPGTITSTLQHVDAPSRIVWSGTSFGIEAMHVYVLERHDRVTLVRTEESYDGLVARLFRGRLQKALERSLETGLRHLKAEAERQTAYPPAERGS